MNDRMKILILVLIGAAIFILISWLKEKKKGRQPTYEYKATIVSKQVVVKAVRGPYGLRNNRSYLIEFKLSDGNVVTLSAPTEMGYPDGTTGTLIFQGTKCEKFTPDKV